MGIFKKNSKIATTDVSTKKSDDDMYNSAWDMWNALKVVNQILTSNPL